MSGLRRRKHSLLDVFLETRIGKRASGQGGGWKSLDVSVSGPTLAAGPEVREERSGRQVLPRSKQPCWGLKLTYYIVTFGSRGKEKPRIQETSKGERHVHRVRTFMGSFRDACRLLRKKRKGEWQKWICLLAAHRQVQGRRENHTNHKKGRGPGGTRQLSDLLIFYQVGKRCAPG